MFGSTDAPGVPTLRSPAWIDLQAWPSFPRHGGRGLAGGAAGRAGHACAILKATTPAEFEAREEIAEAQLLAREFDRGVAWAAAASG